MCMGVWGVGLVCTASWSRPFMGADTGGPLSEVDGSFWEKSPDWEAERDRGGRGILRVGYWRLKEVRGGNVRLVSLRLEAT